MEAHDTAPSVEHLLAEHRRLHVMLRLARSAISHHGGPATNVTVDDVVRVLRQVCEELAHHFADEESGNCLEEIARNRPLLVEQARLICAEHPELLRRIYKLTAQALDDPQTLDQIAIERDFDCFCEQLYAHDAAEINLLRQA